MDNIDEILDRTNISRICSYLLKSGDFEIDYEPFYTEQIQRIRTDFTRELQNWLTDVHKFDALMEPFYEFEEELQNTCMEIGFKCGFKLALQLLPNERAVLDADDSAAINKAFSPDKEYE